MGMTKEKAWKIVELNKKGLTEKQIAEDMGVSVRTISRYKSRLAKEKGIKFIRRSGRTRINL